MSASTRLINTVMNIITMLIRHMYVCVFALGAKKLERSEEIEEMARSKN